MSIEVLAGQIFNKMPEIGKRQRDFMIHLFSLLMVYRGRHNFENLSRYGRHSEVTYRSWYARDFDFITFNQHLINSLPEEERVIAFDPCYLSKSGKHTPGAGYFWSGCAGSTKYGLEIGGFASIGLKTRTAMHLCAHQTIDQEEHKTLLEFYASQLTNQKDALLKLSHIHAVDAFFSKKPYVDSALKDGFCVVSKLARNAVLRYPYLGPHPKRPGKKTEFNGRVDRLNLSEEYFKPCLKEDNMVAYEGRVHAKALKRWVKCVIVHTTKKSGKIKVETFFSTDTTMDGAKVLECYRLRYQIEFLYRDGKQHLGLVECQARSQEKIHTHVNASLTAVSLAKVVHHLGLPENKRGSFSLSSIKMKYFNQDYLYRIFMEFGINPESQINSEQYQELYEYGCIAA